MAVSAEKIGTITPTRTELIRLRKRVALAQRGHDLLKEKMDALVMEFFEILKRIRGARERALQQLSVAHRSLSVCFAVMGTIETFQASKEARKELQLGVSTRNIMGVVVPSLEVEKIERDALARGYSLHMTSSTMDDASKEFEKALKLLIELAEMEESARALARELEKTKRRVNALEYIIIPRLEGTIKFISMKFDERERENFSRLKRIKAMIEGRT
jgi:V/A-type H+-transporting ATPase subunit D